MPQHLLRRRGKDIAAKCFCIMIKWSVSYFWPVTSSNVHRFNKSSAVAEMGDRGHNRHAPKRWVAAVPFRAELGPRLIQCGLGRGLLPYQVASSSTQSFGHNGHWTKIGGCAPLGEGKLGSHITQSRLGWGLPPYQVASWHIQPFGDNKNGSKIGGLAPFLGEGSWGPI